MSDIIELGASASDDIAPLRTAHLELRYFTHAKDAASPSPKKHAAASAENRGESWASAAGELAKYNYTQGKGISIVPWFVVFALAFVFVSCFFFLPQVTTTSNSGQDGRCR